ncbi:hypothetical protein ASG47_19750 [Devosia sp. Leaf420]|uniref:DUF6950 family protein n=1 Tax=Devosia sp. Leaf420 TaxID=1736374 RepID=UPI000714721A|nr:hypothetical protein [Devosia sp. Leaf420]KQT50340.1 hypothetical protein ASG47_19750 [Devosia sp. Leaf420]
MSILQPARHSGWEVAFVETVSRHQNETFKWGESDCLTRVADLSLAMTGVDPMDDIRGTYDSAAASAGVLKDRGYDDIEAALTAHFERYQGTASARRGDCGIVITEAGKREVKAAVIVMGDMVLGCALPSMPETDASGAIWLPRERLVAAFRIG